MIGVVDIGNTRTKIALFAESGALEAELAIPSGPDFYAKLEGFLRHGIVLDRVVIGRPFPPQIASTYSARVAGEQGITVLDAAECWIYQHGLRHMGEIELARGLVGLNGMTS